MSASIVWEPVKIGRSLGVNAPSRFIEALRELAGDFPCELHGAHANALRALACADSGEKAWSQLAEAVDQYDVVRVWAVY